MNYPHIMHKIRVFTESLKKYKEKNVFNPWTDFDPDYDIAHSRSIRKAQLERYLVHRMDSPRLLIVAEACGYQGCRFTGIPLTSERMMLDLHPVVNSKMIIGSPGRRTSRKESPFLPADIQREKGFNEPTDTIVWKAALESGLAPEDFILWNIFPFHPYKPGKMLTNRTPTQKELDAGLIYTEKLLELVGGNIKICAVGKKSETTLKNAGYKVTGVRHPANGGATLFREGLQDFIKEIGV